MTGQNTRFSPTFRYGTIRGTGNTVWVTNGIYTLTNQIVLTNGVTLLGVSQR